MFKSVFCFKSYNHVSACFCSTVRVGNFYLKEPFAIVVSSRITFVTDFLPDPVDIIL